MDKTELKKKPIESAPLTDANAKFKKRLEDALAKDGLKATEVQLITHVRRWSHIGKNDEERFEKTLEKLKDMLDLRKKYDLDNILNKPWPYTDVSFEECQEIWPIFLYKRSDEGLPFLYDYIGACDQKRALAIFTGSDENKRRVKEYLFRVYENFARIKERISKERGLLIYKHCLVLDTSGISLTTIGSVKALAKEAISEIQRIYPDLSRKIFLLNTNWLFRAVYAFVCLFVDRITQEKVKMMGSGWMAEFEKLGYGKDMIPPLFGGTSKEPILMGGDFAYPEYKPIFKEDEEKEDDSQEGERTSTAAAKTEGEPKDKAGEESKDDKAGDKSKDDEAGEESPPYEADNSEP